MLPTQLRVLDVAQRLERHADRFDDEEEFALHRFARSVLEFAPVD